MMRQIALALTFGLWSLALGGASCDKKSAAEPGAGPTHVGMVPEADPKAGAVEDLPGVDLAKLAADQKDRFFKLVDKLPSPCGKAHSLRASLKSDPTCRHAPFAARALARWVAMDDAPSDDEVNQFFAGHYLAPRTAEFDTRSSPFEGVPSAPVVMVEFFDYGCPHCRLFVPILEDVVAELPGEVVLYFKHFPLSQHTSSVPAAIAAVAAHRQGKFRDMHRKLFANQEALAKEDLFRYAQEIGLDMRKFAADFGDPRTRDRVMADRAEGEKAGIAGTPYLFVNGRNYSNPLSLEDIVDWVKEDLAVNR